MKPILQNAELEKLLAENGYVIIPFLNANEVNSLKNFYYEHHARNLNGMYATAHVPDLDLRMKMNDKIKKEFARAIAETFANANPLGGSFIAKGKGDNGTLRPHQDWNIVDEEKFRSFNIWVPLVDLHNENGAICILPKSHLWRKSFRSANTPSLLQNVENDLWKKMLQLKMKAGEALIYDHRLVHASGNNNTDEIRLAAVYGIIPDEAQMKYYHRKNETAIEVYESNPDFFLYGNIFEGPKGLKLSGEFAHAFSPVSSNELNNFTNPQRGIIGRVKAFFTSRA